MKVRDIVIKINGDQEYARRSSKYSEVTCIKESVKGDELIIEIEAIKIEEVF